MWIFFKRSRWRRPFVVGKGNSDFLNPNMTVADVKALVHTAIKQWPNTLESKGTGATFTLRGTANGVPYTMTMSNGRVVQFYPR